MRLFKRLKKPALFLLAFVLVNALLTFFLTPYASPSSEMWDGYFRQQEIDAIYIGTSQCYESVNPEVTNLITGDHAYNMGTNAQSISDTKLALETAFADHEIKEVVFVLDYDSLMKKTERRPKAEACFCYAMNRHLSLPARFKNAISFMFRPDYFCEAESVNYLIPWINNRSNFRPEYMLENAKAKLTGKAPEAGDLNNIRNEYGYKGFYGILDYDEDKDLPKEKEWSEEEVSDRALTKLDDIISLCEKEQAKLLVVVAPETVSEVLSYGDSYFERHAFLREYLNARGVSLYDFNLANPSFYSSLPEDFKDWVHLNDAGAASFSTALATLQNKLRAGEDCEGLFFEGKEAYLSAADRIDSVRLKLYSNGKEGLTAEAFAMTGIPDRAEYEFYMREAGMTEEILVQGYSEKNSLIYQPKKSGTVTVRVNVRRAGSTCAFEHYRTEKTDYWKN